MDLLEYINKLLYTENGDAGVLSQAEWVLMENEFCFFFFNLGLDNLGSPGTNGKSRF